MNKPKTLQDALELVPEYVMLKEEELCRDGDQFSSGTKWHKIPKHWIDSPAGEFCRRSPAGEFCRRPIPQEVRERMARNILNGAKICEAGVHAAIEHFAYNFPAESWLLSQGGRND